MVCKGSAGPPVISKKIILHLTFAATGHILPYVTLPYLRLNPTAGAYSAPLGLLAGGLPPQEPLSRSQPSAVNFGLFGIRSPPKKDTRSVSNQSCCKGFHFTEMPASQLPYGITQCYLPPDTSEHTPPS